MGSHESGSRTTRTTSHKPKHEKPRRIRLSISRGLGENFIPEFIPEHPPLSTAPDTDATLMGSGPDTLQDVVDMVMDKIPEGVPLFPKHKLDIRRDILAILDRYTVTKTEAAEQANKQAEEHAELHASSYILSKIQSLQDATLHLEGYFTSPAQGTPTDDGYHIGTYNSATDVGADAWSTMDLWHPLSYRIMTQEITPRQALEEIRQRDGHLVGPDPNGDKAPFPTARVVKLVEYTQPVEGADRDMRVWGMVLHDEMHQGTGDRYDNLQDFTVIWKCSDYDELWPSS